MHCFPLFLNINLALVHQGNEEVSSVPWSFTSSIGDGGSECQVLRNFKTHHVWLKTKCKASLINSYFHFFILQVYFFELMKKNLQLQLVSNHKMFEFSDLYHKE
ncbi:hypothetical protein DM860_005143 [Cuscuta australis]|uniref:Uncharacterized protein n=1 Tax=Cuscuta australis TaxID=267555 RepID=A0A328DMN3_9ASTE|nr:hypothetical protein DM860_005143 [Cuscuta australis]